MRVLLSTYGSRGDVEPLVALAERLAGVGVPLVPVGPSARELTRAAPAPSSIPQRAAAIIASQFDVVTAAAGATVAARRLLASAVTPAGVSR